MMGTGNPKLSDAFQWLFAELDHIRRIHFILIVLSSLTIIATALGHSALTTDLYRELENFKIFAKQLSSEMDSRKFFTKHIENYLPEGIPKGYEFLFNWIPKEQAIKLAPMKIAPLKINSLDNQLLSVIHERIEQIGVEVTLIHKIGVDKKMLEDYDKFKTRTIWENLAIGDFSASIIEWPSEEKLGKIEFTMAAGRPWAVERLQRYNQPFGTTDIIPIITYKGSASFLTKKERWQIDANWFGERFPNLAKDWDKYKNKTLGNLLVEIRRNLIQKLQNVNLPPLGITIPAEYAVFFLPVLLILTFLVLFTEVSHVADFARFCKTAWPHSQCLLSPWIGGRNWWYRGLVLVITLIILPGSAITYLLWSFPVLGVRTSYYLLSFFILIVFVLGCITIRKGEYITLISFKQKC